MPEPEFNPDGGERIMFGVTVGVRVLLKLAGLEKLCIEPVVKVLFWGIKWLGLLLFICYQDRAKK